MRSKATEFMTFLKRNKSVAAYSDIIKAGFSKTTLNTLLRSGKILRINRGLYTLSGGANLSDPDLVIVSRKIQRGVLCLISALAYHEATDEIPRQIHIAIPRGTHANKIQYPPVQFYRFSNATWKSGIEEHKIDDSTIQVYSLAKTVADCFKFRNKIGMAVARNALKTAVADKHVSPKEIMHYAKICRVHNIVKPILETLL